MQPSSIAGVYAVGVPPRSVGPAASDVPRPGLAAATNNVCYVPAGNGSAAVGQSRVQHSRMINTEFGKLLPKYRERYEKSRTVMTVTGTGRPTTPTPSDTADHHKSEMQPRVERHPTMKKRGFSIDDILHSRTIRKSSPPPPPPPPTSSPSRSRCSPPPEVAAKRRSGSPLAPSSAPDASLEFFARLQSKFYQDLKLSGIQLSALRASSKSDILSLSDGLTHLYSSTAAPGAAAAAAAYYNHPSPQLMAAQHHHHPYPYSAASYGAHHHHHASHLHPHHPAATHPSLSVPIPVPVYLRGKSPAISQVEAARAAKKCRRSRTVFTELQLMGLEKRFEKQKYLSTPDRLELAETLGLSQLQVKTWYQNRRMKWKKQVMQSGRQEPPTKPKGRPKKNDVTGENAPTSPDSSSDFEHDALSDMSDVEELPVCIGASPSSEPHHHHDDEFSISMTSQPQPIGTSAYSPPMELPMSAT